MDRDGPERGIADRNDGLRTKQAPGDGSEPGQCNRPDGDHHGGAEPAGWPRLQQQLRSPGPVFRENGGGDQPNRERETQGNEQQVVEIADDGNEVGDEVDGAQRVGDDERGDELRDPGNAGIAIGEVERVGVRLESGGSGLPSIDARSGQLLAYGPAALAGLGSARLPDSTSPYPWV